MSKCLECGYYDKEKHYCPFYCQLIRETLDEAISFELEKVKAELQSPEEIGLDFFDGLDYAERVIDKRIEELKGE